MQSHRYELFSDNICFLKPRILGSPGPSKQFLQLLFKTRLNLLIILKVEDWSLLI
jgi:hypothetical protein